MHSHIEGEGDGREGVEFSSQPSVRFAHQLLTALQKRTFTHDLKLYPLISS